MTRWLIIQSEYGQLGNRLHTHANALAWCIQNNTNLLNLGFRSSSSLFNQENGIPIHLWFGSHSFLNRIFLKTKEGSFVDRLARSNKYLSKIHYCLKVLEKEHNEFLKEEELSMCFKKNLRKTMILSRAWDLRCPNALTAQQDKIRKLLSPENSLQKFSEERVGKLKQKFELLVGVHARRGDYRHFLDGIHFHCWSRYKKWIAQVKNLLELEFGRQVGFLLCSDETPPVEEFGELPVFYFRNSDPMIDLHALSLCNYIIGPPSSFGTWVSFHGKVPRIIIKAETEIISLSQFTLTTLC